MPVPLDEILSRLSPERRARIADLAAQFEDEEKTFENSSLSADQKGRFVLYSPAHGRYRFRLVAPDGRVVIDSADYASQAAAEDALELLRRSAAEADVVISAG